MILASISAINPLLLKAVNITIGRINPNNRAVEIRTNLFLAECSNTNAKEVNNIIVKEGGTKIVEIILAVFIEILLFNLIIHNLMNPRFMLQFHIPLSVPDT